MKYVSVFIMFQGLLYVMYSNKKLFSYEYFKLGKILLSPSLWYLGVFFGVLLLISGIGIIRKKRFAYFVAIGLYSILIIYGIISLVYIVCTTGFDLIFISSVLIALGVDYLILDFIRKHRNDFTKKSSS